jgi:hypothetical protein
MPYGGLSGCYVMIFKDFFTKTTLWTLAISGLLLGVFVYATIDRTAYDIEELLIVPDQVVSDSWVDIENVLSSEISAYSLYQDFNKNNSARLNFALLNPEPDRTDSGVSLPEDGEVNLGSQTSTENTSVDGSVETEDSVEPSTEEVQPSEQGSSSSEQSDQSQSESESGSQPEPEAPSQEASSEVSLNYRALPVTGLYKLLQAELETELLESTELGGPVTEDIVSTIVPELEDGSDTQTTSSEVDSMFEVSGEVPVEPVVTDSADESQVDTSVQDEVTDENSTSTEEGIDYSEVDEDLLEEEYVEDVEDETVPTIYDECAEEEGCAMHSASFAGFTIPEFNTGEYLAYLQLRLSLAAKLKSNPVNDINRYVVEYTYEDEGGWRIATVLDIEDEISNSINGGYFLVALDKPLNQNQVSNLKVRVSFQGNIKDLETAYLESIWLEVKSASFYEETDPMFLSGAIDYSRQLESPKFHELYNPDLDPAMAELPAFTMSYSPQQNFLRRAFTALFSENEYAVDKVNLIDAAGEKIEVPVKVEYHDDRTWTLQFLQQPQKIVPGKYKLEIIIDENGETYTDSFEFYWGVLAVNTTKSIYLENESVTLNLAALTEKGDTICDAWLELKIIDPNYNIEEVAVEQSGACDKNNVTDIPDYLAYFNNTASLGRYTIQLNHLNKAGEVVHKIEDHFEVRDYVPYDIERTAPTRIYPPAPYEVTINIKANRTFTGDIIERLPRGFIFPNTGGAEIVTLPTHTELVWQNINLNEGDEISLTYEFDAPDISPYLYLLGPLNMDGFEEIRQWQIASDALTAMASFTGTRTVAGTNLNQAASPLQWSGASIDPFYYDHSTTTNSHEITIRQSGDYFLSVNLPQERTDANNSRTRVGVEVRVNGIALYDAVGRSGYIRNQSGHAESSSYVNLLIPGLAVDDIVEVYAEGLTTVDAGDVVNVSGLASMSLEFIGTGAGVFSATTTQTTNSTNLNQATAYPLTWTETRQDTGFVHSDTVNPENIIISNPGTYYVSVNVPITNDIAQTNIRGEIILDGTLVPGGVFAQGYAQNSGTESDGDSSIHWSGVVVTTAANQVLTVTTLREARAGTVTVTSGLVGSIFVRELPTDDILVLRGTNLVGGTNWNPAAAAAVQWATEVRKDATVFTHSTTTNSHQITIAEDGDYFISFNDALNGALARANTRVVVNKNGTPVSGAQTKSHYIRNQQGHTESSGALTMVLEGLLIGDVITLTTQQEASAGTLNDTTDAVLMLWKKASLNFRPEAPVTTVPFDNIRFASSTPYFEFSANDPDGTSDIEYEFSIATNTAFTASTTYNSGVSSDFFNLSSSTDSSPFVEGDTIRFQLPSGDALADGSTYYWRVRAKDVTGSDEFSDWSTTKSLTVDLAAEAPSWFQSFSGQFEGNSLIGTVSSGADRIQVDATVSSEVLLAYGEGTVTTPRFRLWNGTTWSVEGSAQAVSGTINWIKTAAGVNRDEYAMITLDSANDSFAQIYSASTSSWGNRVLMSPVVNNAAYRGVAVAYESVSGDLMAVSCTNSPNPIYRIWDGSSWSATSSITVSSLNNCNFLEIASDPASDEIILLVRDTGTQYEALVWNGSAWVESRVIGSSAKLAREGMAIAYETSGDQAVIVASNGIANNFIYTTWNGVEFSTNATQALGNDFEFGRLATDPNSDRMALCYIDEDNDVGVVRWDGGVWSTFVELETLGNADTGRPVECAFETLAGRSDYLMSVYSDTANVRYRSATSTVWSAEASVSTIEDSFWVQVERAGDGSLLQVNLDDFADNLEFSSWNGSSWSSKDILETQPLFCIGFSLRNV